MTVIKIIFWFSFFILVYAYVGYGILLFFLVQLKRLFKKRIPVISAMNFEPEVTLIIAAFNEAGFIEQKIQNTRALNYPAARLKVIFITDGSTDETPDIIKRFREFQLLHEAERRGKVAAINRAMQFVNTPFVIFSDANTLLNPDCIQEMVAHYADPAVGGVAGEKKIRTSVNDQAAGVGEGLYWKYESFLKKMDSEFYSVVGAAGELFSVRVNTFEKIAENIIIEDFVLSMRICLKGYVIRYEPRAFALETSSESIQEEEKRKVRICAGAFQAMGIIKDSFNIFRHPLLSFQFISHRILRWTLCPLCLVSLFLTNLIIALKEINVVYGLFFLLQLLFYLLGWIGRLYAGRNIMVKLLYVPYYFLFMNISVYMGFYRFLKKNQTVLWERASRKQL